MTSHVLVLTPCALDRLLQRSPRTHVGQQRALHLFEGRAQFNGGHGHRLPGWKRWQGGQTDMDTDIRLRHETSVRPAAVRREEAIVGEMDAGACHTASHRHLDVDILRAVLHRRGMTVDDFADRAGASRTMVSAALNREERRNVAVKWVLAQSADFIADWMAETRERTRVPLVSERERSFEAFMAEMRAQARTWWFRERLEERAR